MQIVICRWVRDGSWWSGSCTGVGAGSVDNRSAIPYCAGMTRDVHHVVRDCLFVWNAEKANANMKKHGVSFMEACEVFFFPYYRMEDAGLHDEERWAITGYARRGASLVRCRRGIGRGRVEDCFGRRSDSAGKGSL